MRSVHESNVTDTADPGVTIAAATGSRSSGIWTLAGDRLIIADSEGPATILIPSESVRLLAVDLPLRSRAKRLQALPFALEDRIAEKSDGVHLALGTAIAPNRYLAGVVAHERMRHWVELAEAAGLERAALVPDALALPMPPEGCWSVDLGETRAVVRSADGTGFALAAPMLWTAWERAGRPACVEYGDPLPEDMVAGDVARPTGSRVERLAVPALDLRQGAYARQRAVSDAGWGRRVAWILGLGAVAHIAIAGADTLMLRAIADRREADTRALVATMAPGAGLPQDGPIAGAVADLIPAPTGERRFVSALTRVSGALTPLAGSIAVRDLRFAGDMLTIDLASSAPGMVGRIDAALRDANISATVRPSTDGAIHITAQAL
ncbi:type II secretion system protein GspL [Stakelama saccharophila]|uniref:Type II secretion system protein GspL n=1 Tax=Stakelama saccharophila TaxID=3075605 RepID=A0ABZ0BDH5_9SPHN|nr:type II secretion system protein GspL [Stakelama sp. W311]WNO54791.1 type II secretion system protein GspL [Stakelama sp. W311]